MRGTSYLQAISLCALQACAQTGASTGAGSGGADSGADGAADAATTVNGVDGAPSGDRDGDRLSDADEDRLGTDPDNPDTDGDGMLDGDEIVLGTDPRVADQACADATAQASAIERPADIIFVIDNSPSMGDEIKAVEDNINDNFAAIIGASAVDYKILVLSRHGDWRREDICIRAPLSGTDCSPIPDAPANTPRFFQHDIGISSSSSLADIIDSYPAWASQLRSDAVRVFIEISDDDPSRSADQFETALFALGGFGDASDRNYIFHSIVGLRAKTPPDTPYLPTEPIQSEKCEPGAVDEAPQYQELSQRSGGLRFPVCHHASYDAVFREVATGIVDITELPCSYAPPVPADGDALDLDRVVVVFTAGDGAQLSLTRVDTAADCRPHAFYLIDDRIELCPQTCDLVVADAAGQVAVHVACVPDPID